MTKAGKRLIHAAKEALKLATNPGSPQAVSAGCRCPVMDNGHGRGYMGQPGIFVMNVDCPLHGDKVRND